MDSCYNQQMENSTEHGTLAQKQHKSSFINFQLNYILRKFDLSLSLSLDARFLLDLSISFCRLTRNFLGNLLMLCKIEMCSQIQLTKRISQQFHSKQIETNVIYSQSPAQITAHNMLLVTSLIFVLSLHKLITLVCHFAQVYHTRKQYKS